MGKNKTQNLLAALLAAIVSNILLYLLGLVLRIPVPNMFMAILITTIECAVILGAATAIFCVAFAKKNPNVGALIGLSIAAGLISSVINQLIFRFLIYSGMIFPGWNFIVIIIRFVLFFGAAFLILTLSKEKQPKFGMYGTPYYAPNQQQPQNPSSYNAAADSASSAGTTSGTYSGSVTDELAELILMAVKPQLKSPFTAVLCSKEEMLVIPDGKGGYDITGYVNSQNSYGAMIRTSFKVNAANYGSNWQILSCKVGEREAKIAGKNFAYIWIIAIVLTLLTSGFFYIIYSSALF